MRGNLEALRCCHRPFADSFAPFAAACFGATRQRRTIQDSARGSEQVVLYTSVGLLGPSYKRATDEGGSPVRTTSGARGPMGFPEISKKKSLNWNDSEDKTRMRVIAASPSAEFREVPKYDFWHLRSSEQHAEDTSGL